MPSEPNDRVERIQSLPTNEELGIEKFPVARKRERPLMPPVCAAKIPAFEGLVVSERVDQR